MITLDEAREIAYTWHGGGGSSLYSFASTSGHGTPQNVTPETVAEVEKDIAEFYVNHGDRNELQSLRAYLIANLPAQPEEEEL